MQCAEKELGWYSHPFHSYTPIDIHPVAAQTRTQKHNKFDLINSIAYKILINKHFHTNKTTIVITVEGFVYTFK